MASSALQVLQGRSTFKWARIVHSLARKRRINLPVQKEEVKEKSPNREKVTVATVHIADHRQRTTSDELLQCENFETSMNSHSKGRGKPRATRRSKMPLQGIIALESKLLSEESSIKFSYQSLEGARFRDTIPCLNVIQTCSKKGRSSKCTTVRSQMYSVE